MNNISFSKQQTAEEFDWHRFLNQTWYSDNELAFAHKKACSWVTCAVGVQCAIIPRSDEGVPLDSQLDDHGVHFMFLIGRMEYYEKHNNPDRMYQYRNEARSVLAQIEERSATLIARLQFQTS